MNGTPEGLVLVYQKFLDTLRNYRPGDPTDSLVMERAGTIAVEYAPFDHVERGAELVIVGLTPGRTQAANALSSFTADLKRAVPIETALYNAKQTASFSGPMRANLLAMLDAVAVPAVYGRINAAEFFSANRGLVHFTSALRYPVFIDGNNYSGTPDPLKHPTLLAMIETYLAEEARALPNATWIPLGRHAEAALLHLAAKGELARENILAGLPHPSGANAERIAYFLGRKARENLSPKTNPDKMDALKRELVGQVSRLKSRLGEAPRP